MLWTTGLAKRQTKQNLSESEKQFADDACPPSPAINNVGAVATSSGSINSPSVESRSTRSTSAFVAEFSSPHSKKTDRRVKMSNETAYTPTSMKSKDDDADDIEMGDVSSPDTPKSSGQSRSGRAVIADVDDPDMMLYRPGKVDAATRCCRRLSAQRPRAFGAIMFTLICGLPMLIVIIILGVMLKNRWSAGEPVGDVLAKSPVDEKLWTEFSVSSKIAVIATDDARCSQIGRDIMRRGGNAVDAAVAAALCLGIVSPGSSGIGGGCFILYHNATTQTNEFIDSREYAPSGARPHMFENDPVKAQDGGLAVAVLGELKGLHLAWSRYGNMSWNELVAPAAELAKNWVISLETANLLLQVKKQLHSGLFPGLSKLYLKSDGTMKTVGDTVQQPELSATLMKIGEFGPDYIYNTMASTLASEIRAAGGIMTAEDIEGYKPNTLQPLTVDFMGHTYVGVGGSSSGGPAVAGMMEFMGGYEDPLASEGMVYFHRLVEAFNHIFAIRLALGDPAFVNTTGPANALLSKSYMAQLRSITSDEKALPLSEYGGKYNINYDKASAKKDHGTTHLSVLDKWGNAVAMTTTINTYFGSKVISPSTGILFNNQMDDFSVPGAPNFFGLAPSPYNYPEPFKRPLSSMSPSFILDKKGKLRLVGGGSGGPRIITATAQTILNVIALGMDLLAAVRAPRLHTQLLPPIVYAENHTLLEDSLSIRTPENVRSYLHKCGHNLTADAVMGVTQFIEVDSVTGIMRAVSDPRKDGKPAAI